jgi:hypothetical protein
MKSLLLFSALAVVAAAQVSDNPPPIFSTPPVTGVSPGPQSNPITSGVRRTNSAAFTNLATVRGTNRFGTNAFGAPGSSTNSQRGGATNRPVVPPGPVPRPDIPTLPGTPPTEPGVPPANPGDIPPIPPSAGTAPGIAPPSGSPVPPSSGRKLQGGNR